MSSKILISIEIELGDLELGSAAYDILEGCFQSEVSFYVNYTAGCDAKLDAPMEDCYPAEGAEWELDDSTNSIACGMAEDYKSKLAVSQIVELVDAIDTQLAYIIETDQFKDLVTERAECEPEPEREYEREE